MLHREIGEMIGVVEVERTIAFEDDWMESEIRKSGAKKDVAGMWPDRVLKSQHSEMSERWTMKGRWSFLRWWDGEHSETNTKTATSLDIIHININISRNISGWKFWTRKWWSHWISWKRDFHLRSICWIFIQRIEIGSHVKRHSLRWIKMRCYQKLSIYR
jgi:hypothetical protein